MPYRRPIYGNIAVVLAAIALVAVPAASLAVNKASADRKADVEVDLATIDREGTRLAVEGLADAKKARDALDARLTYAEARLDNLETRLGEMDEDAQANADLTLDRSGGAGSTYEASDVDVSQPMTAMDSGDRWDALAACESTGDTDGVAPHVIDQDPPGNYLTAFQFTQDTWDKVSHGVDAHAATYAQAKAAAQEWAAKPDVDASSTMGWPTCWPKVMGDTPT